MNEKVKILDEAKESILAITAQDLQNPRIVNSITDLRTALEDLIRIYRFPKLNGRRA